MDVTIVVERVLPMQQFTKRDGSIGVRYSFIGATNTGKFDKKMKFDVVNQDTWTTMAIQQGQTYVVSFDAESRSYNSPTKGELWFTSLTAWRAVLQQMQYQQPQHPQQIYQQPQYGVPQPQYQQPMQQQAPQQNNQTSDVPF